MNIKNTHIYHVACDQGKRLLDGIADTPGRTLESAWKAIEDFPTTSLRTELRDAIDQITPIGFASFYNQYIAPDFSVPILEAHFSDRWKDFCTRNPCPFKGNQIITEKDPAETIDPYEQLVQEQIKELEEQLAQLKKRHEENKNHKPRFQVGDKILVPAVISQIHRTMSTTNPAKTRYTVTIDGPVEEDLVYIDYSKKLKDYEKTTGENAWLKRVIKTRQETNNGWPLEISDRTYEGPSHRGEFFYSKDEAMLIATKILRDMTHKKD